MATITRLEELEIWQMARRFAKDVNLLVIPNIIQHDAGLARQMRNSSGSIMDNIAEGFGRTSKKEFINHLSIARGSAEETRSQLYRCGDSGLVTRENLTVLLEDSGQLIKRIAALINYLNKTPIPGTKFRNRR